MKKLISVAVAVLLPYVPAFADVVCESMVVCRVPSPPLDYESNFLAVDVTSAGPVSFTVNYWGSQGCVGDPDQIIPLDFDIPRPGHWGLPLDFGPQDDGTPYSVIWQTDGCVPTNCVNGTIGSTPDICE